MCSSPAETDSHSTEAALSARVCDADRQRALDLLTDACGDGLLDVGELDERLGAVLAARTSAQLSVATADLSTRWQAERRARARAARAVAEVDRVRRAQLRTFAGVMAFLVVVWLAVAVTGGSWYPWPIWPAMGWGAGLALQRIGVRAR